MNLSFWGTRGSIPTPGAGTLRYGGNTACVAVRSRAGTVVVLDCGTGAHGLGRELAARAIGPLRGHLLITHTHWDHIQGFPFFRPIFLPDARWDIYGPRGLGGSLQEAVTGQMEYRHFPVPLPDLGAERIFHELVEGRFEIDDIRVTTHFLNHPALTLGYRLEVDGVSVVYATDHEPHVRRHGAGIPDDLAGEDGRLAAFMADADLLIQDAQYTAAEYPEKVGWGHGTMEYVVDLAARAGVRRVALFHHDPWRDDAALAEIEAAARRRAVERGGRMDVFAAAEGRVLDLARLGGGSRRRAATGAAAVAARADAEVAHAVLVAAADPGVAAALVDAVRQNGFAAREAADGAAAAAELAAGAPSLVLLDDSLADPDAFTLCRTLREAAMPGEEATPIVLVLRGGTPGARRAASDAGATDVIEKPFTTAYARARIGAWVLRTGGRWVAAPIPADTAARDAALEALEILDTPREERFDRLTRMASRLLNVPITALTLIHADRQVFKSIHGLDATQSTRDVAFCAHTILGDVPLVVPDAHLDERFADNPLVAGVPGIRFYAGVPLCTDGGAAVGSFCVIDFRPRELSAPDMALLKDLAAMAQEELLRGAGTGG